MQTNFRVFLLLAIAVYFFMIFCMIKKRQLGLKYALLWLGCGLAMLLFAIFPQIIIKGSALIGIMNPVNAVFFIFVVLFIVLLLSMTAITSALSEKALRLSQTIALLEERIRKLESKDK